MSALQLSENMLLQVGNDGGAEQMRVLWLEPARVASPRAAVIFTTRKKGMPEWRECSELSAGIASGLYLLPARDELLVRALRDEEELTDLEKEKRNARFDLIKDMVLDPERHVLYADARRKMILEVCRLRGTPTKTIYHHLRLWWQRGQTANALLPDYINVGRPGSRVCDDSSQRPKVGRRRKTREGEASTQGTNVDTRTRKLLVLGAERFYEKQKLSMKAAFDLTLKSYFTVGHIVEPDGTLVPQIIGGDDCPTIHQFEYHHDQALQQKAAAIRRKGLKRYLLEDRPRLGTTVYLAPGPGSRYEVDATRGDVALLSSLRRTRIIGRPVIFIVRDVFSRMIVGFYICLEGPNWTGLRMALQSAMMDKVEFCRRFGRVITADEWPCAHRPETIFGDRGPAELLSKHADFLFNSFAIRADNAAPSRPDWKPVVERFFRTMNDKGVHWQPGAVHGARSRGEPDSRLEAIHTLESFNRLFLEIVLHYNNHTWLEHYNAPEDVLYDEVPLVPIELWKWGVENRGAPRPVASFDDVRRSLTRKYEATVTPDGLHVPGLDLLYTCDRAVEEEWFDLQRGRRRPRVEMGIDDRDVSEAYIRLDHGRLVEPCTLVPKHEQFRGHGRDEMMDERAWAAVLTREAERDSAQARVSHLQRMENISREAAAARADAVEEEGSKPKIGSHADRTAERDRARAQEQLADRPGQDAAAAGGAPSGDDEEEEVPPPHDIALLRETWEDDS